MRTNFGHFLPVHFVGHVTPVACAVMVCFDARGSHLTIPGSGSKMGRRIKCKEEGCGATFASVTNRNRHARMVHGEGTHCDICNVRVHDWDRHVKSRGHQGRIDNDTDDDDDDDSEQETIVAVSKPVEVEIPGVTTVTQRCVTGVEHRRRSSRGRRILKPRIRLIDELMSLPAVEYLEDTHLRIERGALGLAVFAVRDIPEDRAIGPYRGVPYNHAAFYALVEQHRQWNVPGKMNYFMASPEDDYYVDAAYVDCISKYVNHNCKRYNCLFRFVSRVGVPGVELFSIRNIAAGEELTVKYCRNVEEMGFVCQCVTCRAVPME